SRRRWAQRARDMPPVLGVVAVAAYAANRVQMAVLPWNRGPWLPRLWQTAFFSAATFGSR
ncbi:hypothetical protein ACWDBO_37510, partial [Streptomyces mirabilis]